MVGDVELALPFEIVTTPADVTIDDGAPDDDDEDGEAEAEAVATARRLDPFGRGVFGQTV